MGEGGGDGAVPPAAAGGAGPRSGRRTEGGVIAPCQPPARVAPHRPAGSCRAGSAPQPAWKWAGGPWLRGARVRGERPSLGVRAGSEGFCGRPREGFRERRSGGQNPGTLSRVVFHRVKPWLPRRSATDGQMSRGRRHRSIARGRRSRVCLSRAPGEWGAGGARGLPPGPLHRPSGRAGHPTGAQRVRRGALAQGARGRCNDRNAE